MLLTLASCHTARNVARQEAPASQPTPPPAAPTSEPKEDTLFSTVQATFTCTAQGITANGLLRMERDSAIWVSVSKIIELGRARITPDSVVAYIGVTNECLQMTMAEAQRRYGIDYSMLQGLLLGEPLASPLIASPGSQPDPSLPYPFPHSLTVSLSHPQLRTKVNLRFSKTTFNLPLSFPLHLPKSAKPLSL